MSSNEMIKEQIGKYKKLTGDEEKYNFYFTNSEGGNTITKESLFYQSYIHLKDGLDKKIISAKYDTLILLVGFSVQPLVLSISVLNPKKVYLLYSNETKQNCLKIMLWINRFIAFKNSFFTVKESVIEFVGADLWEKSDCQYLINSSDPDDTYNKVLSIVTKEKDNGPVAIDITGGKKTMVSGAFIAASMTGTDALYVDFGDYDGSNPIPGTEFIRLQKNPIEILLLGLKKIFSEIDKNGKITQNTLEKSKDYEEIYPLLIKYGILTQKKEFTKDDFFHTDFQNH